MAVYNDQRFLDEAVDSILRQDFRDFEFIIVDDGSSRPAVFDELAQRDPRIRIVTNPTNLGAAEAANRGIAAARADIIIRLDADDIAEPRHIAELVAALAADPELGLVGSAVDLIDEAGHFHRLQKMPESDLEIRWTILFHNPFYHSTVAFRRSCFEAAGRYRPEELVSQDHYLWAALLPLCRARNLAEPLTRYRLNPQGLTATNANNPRSRTHPIREALWAGLGLSYELYDNAAAGDVSHFLRGFEIVDATRREAAYRTILTVLQRFLAARPRARAEDDEAARQLTRSLMARILNSPPADLQGRFATLRRCVKLDMIAALATLSRGLATGITIRLARPSE